MTPAPQKGGLAEVWQSSFVQPCGPSKAIWETITLLRRHLKWDAWMEKVDYGVLFKTPAQYRGSAHLIDV